MTMFLSGIQPSGVFHLGNYFGAIKQHIAISKNLSPADKAFYFIADYHALTTVKNKLILQNSVHALAATYLALGLKPSDNVVLFRQSDIPEVTELNFLFATVTSMAEAERAHAYKDKVGKGLMANVGLFTYPILMAADIAIYDTDVVPIGKDQIQHVEMAQDIVTHFNTIYNGQYLKKPQFKLSENPRVIGTNGDKMSKSYKNTIGIFSSGKQLKSEIAAIVTDSLQPYDSKIPETVTLYQILKLFLTEDESKDIESRMITGGPNGPGYGELKALLAERMESTFGECRELYTEYMLSAGGKLAVNDYLEQSAEAARAVARKTLARCYDAVGMPNAAIRLRKVT